MESVFSEVEKNSEMGYLRKKAQKNKAQQTCLFNEISLSLSLSLSFSVSL